MENQPNLTITEKLKINVKKQLPPNGFNIIKESHRGKLSSKLAINSNNLRETTTPEKKVKKNKPKSRPNVLTKVGNGVVIPPGR